MAVKVSERQLEHYLLPSMLMCSRPPGYPSLAPYAAIHVGAAAPSDVPPALLQQLASPGRLVCPVQGADGQQ
jgi:hypothetical protein